MTTQAEVPVKWKVSGIPLNTRETLRMATFPRKDSSAYKMALEFLQGLFSILVLQGPAGTGKTGLAIAIAWEYLERGLSVRYGQVEEVLDGWRQLYDRAPGEALDFEGVFRGWKDSPLTVLDDLGAGRLTEWAEVKVTALIDYRWLRGLPLVVTLNEPLDTLPPRVADRLADVQKGRVALMVGESLRLPHSLPAK